MTNVDDGITDAGDTALAVACADGEVFSISAVDQQQQEQQGGEVVTDNVEAKPTGLDTTQSGVAYS